MAHLGGPGTGSFSLGFGQIHQITQMSLRKKQAVTLGHGQGVWSRIHIQDISQLFFLLVTAILDGKPTLPSGRQGYYFVEHGSQSWHSISERIAKAGKKAGAFESEDVGSVGLKEVAEEFFNGVERDGEGVLGSKYVILRIGDVLIDISMYADV